MTLLARNIGPATHPKLFRYSVILIMSVSLPILIKPDPDISLHFSAAAVKSPLNSANVLATIPDVSVNCFTTVQGTEKFNKHGSL